MDGVATKGIAATFVTKFTKLDLDPLLAAMIRAIVPLGRAAACARLLPRLVLALAAAAGPTQLRRAAQHGTAGLPAAQSSVPADRLVMVMV